MSDEPISTSKYVGASVKEKQFQLYKLSHDYLIENFHKFTQANKIKVSLVIVSKFIPTTVEGALTVTKMPSVTLDGKPLDLNVG